MNRTSLTLFAQVTESDTQNLYDIAIAKGIVMPHPALGIFKSVLAEIEAPNANGVRLGKKGTQTAVSTLIGTQVNQNHSVRRDKKTGEFVKTPIILGHTIDARINDKNQIEIVCLFYKYQYFDAWENAQELFDENKLTMSFELSHDIESTDKLADGTIRLNDYYFTGAGLLFGVSPACKKAHVELMATKQLEEKLSRERQCLIFANNQSSQKSIMEVLKQMADEVKKIEEPVATEIANTVPPTVEEPKTEEATKKCSTCGEIMKDEVCAKCKEAEAKCKSAQVCPECNEPMKDNECAVCKTKKAEAEVSPVAETPKVEEAKVEEVVAQPMVEEKQAEPTVVVTEVTQKVTDTMAPGTEVVKVETTEVRTVNNQEQQKTVTTQETTYTYAQVEEIKASYEKQIAELKTQITSKDAEIVAMKEKVAKEEIVATEKVKLSTGHNAVEQEEEAAQENHVTPLAKVLRNRKR